MENNVHVPSLSPPSQNGSIENNSTNFATLFQSSTTVGHLSFDNINGGGDKLSPLLPLLSPPPLQLMPQSTILGIPSESAVPPQEPSEQMQPRSTVVAFAKRPRERPPSLENEPTPSVELALPSTSILQEREDFLKPIVLIIPAGTDIVNAIVNFGCDHDANISVHHASGLICEVDICNPLSTSNDLSFQGNFHMISLTGFYTNNLSTSPPNNIPYSSFTIQFMRQSPPKLFSGLIGGKLIAAEPVQVMASIVKKHEYHKMVHPISTNPNFQPAIKSTRANQDDKY